MNIFKFELKKGFRSTIIWTISLILIGAMFIALVPVFVEGKDQFMKMIESYPKELITALGFDIDNFTNLGFFSYISNYIVLAASIQAANLGLGVISKEMRNKTMDFLMTKPISRTKILASKIIAGIVLLLFTSIIYNVFSTILMLVVTNGDINIQTFILMNAVILFMQVMFFSLGILIATISKKIKSVVGISMALVMGLYIVSVLQKILDINFLKYITPFEFFNTTYIAYNGAYDIPLLIYSVIIIITIITISFIVYRKKDIHAV